MVMSRFGLAFRAAVLPAWWWGSGGGDCFSSVLCTLSLVLSAYLQGTLLVMLGYILFHFR